jgi:hypothetical protein
MFVAEMFRSMHAMREHCSSLEKEIVAMRADNEQRVADVHRRCAAMEDEMTSNKHKHKKAIAELQKLIAGISEHTMMYMQENIDAVYATAQENKTKISEIYAEIYDCNALVDRRLVDAKDRMSEIEKELIKRADEDHERIKLIDRRLVEMKSRIIVVETRSEHTVEKTDNLLECLSLLRERITTTEESTKQIGDINEFISILHERLMINEEETNKHRAVLQQRGLSAARHFDPSDNYQRHRDNFY